MRNEWDIDTMMRVKLVLTHLTRPAAWLTPLESIPVSLESLDWPSNEIKKAIKLPQSGGGPAGPDMSSVQLCSGCGGLLQPGSGEAVVRFQDNQYHRKCFTCSHCHNLLDPSTLNDSDPRLLCKPWYTRSYFHSSWFLTSHSFSFFQKYYGSFQTSFPSTHY